ncbi:profilin [Streptomyces sp. NBC_01558]|uniref:profilin n=1 Tax=Streptomyces sp. NBC_01558 TaxID=2975878 RepID=UPI002DDA6081|nr:profilin [Streptomyces sp. NBC_01558]WSD75039.1 profilin [Streptomyces sp. NBC_01558]
MGAWQAYVDNNLVGAGLTQGAILGTDHNAWSTWAASPGFTVSGAERETLLTGLEDPASAFASGIGVNGQTHLTIKADARSIHGRNGPDGVVAARADGVIVIGVYTTTITPGAAARTVEILADHLRRQRPAPAGPAGPGQPRSIACGDWPPGGAGFVSPGGGRR